MDTPINYKNTRHCNGKAIDNSYNFYNSHTIYTYGRGYFVHKGLNKNRKINKPRFRKGEKKISLKIKTTFPSTAIYNYNRLI